ncbi:UDP-N-acetylmuramate--L-alanine ligase [Candidatus Woesebacteria bacterium RIFCSPHIGHO2_01_FULL_39_17]|uniref:UDP-N-acetylmuramate--L-alanine ligase n=2 Tax=Candidatus Woeseibacteriota TaxID=1752722 RepID=A0A0G0NAI4_9BACT|nr:MAG: UDP-N-acetylmuramate-L-alanine ligase [Microgenomates group bacterium GW2011_GWC1_38_12]KKR13149.1 MAG: UDP-N-acetylmuramate-L-alanine ligase [Candidatus Woesebacteria bacterium GW2011_GWA1_39_21b]OGM22302.1 MAG: UDP-N-acetylmuramate--L-alanine ligase [Candidatus Woesebacteria bacterium RIFCSPHIGHO2_01_FULL_39_17]OGM61863.1 MAG: UDP-N-acetylmuramate--L-alanine ligase [Candidatus Woesebacteria bacterium RIFCSPLOWO2_01_FULL_39_14]
MDITKLKHVHLTGIKGVGMTALALCMRDLGIKVTGSDVEEEFVTDVFLRKNHIDWNIGFGEKNLSPRPDLLVTTAAHSGLLNPEVQSAKNLGIKITTFAEFLAELANTKEVVGVCGVGGKTSTASMITVLLNDAGLHPSFAIGVGNIYPIGVSGRFDKKGKNFVCEADEYVVSPGVNNIPKFMLLNPKILVVTNIEYDHPDIYASFEDTKKAFRKLFEKLPSDGLLIACIDNSNVSDAIKGLRKPVITYGFNQKADWQIKVIKFKAQKTFFSLYSKKENRIFDNLELNIRGRFNVQNAAATFIVGNFLGIDKLDLRRGLSSYLGCRRRFEKMGEYKKALFFDDYAHHPEEIKAALIAAREWFPKKRIVSIFQPHTYSRTKALFKEFSEAFADADIVGFMDIYASARESKDASVSSELLAKETRKNNPEAFYLGGHKKTLEWINKNVKKGDVVLTMGAGDIFHIYNNLFKHS